MRIALFSEVYWPMVSGVGVTLLRLTEALRARGHEVRVYSATYPLPPGVPDESTGPAEVAARRVINNWLKALRHGDIKRAAHYFALPSKFQNATPVLLSWCGVLVSPNRASHSQVTRSQAQGAVAGMSPPGG